MMENHLQALASELGANLSAAELRAIIEKSIEAHKEKNNALPKWSPVRGHRTKKHLSYADNMREASNNLASAVNNLKRGIIVETPKQLAGWSKGEWHSNNQSCGSDYKPRPEPQYTNRDPCLVCGARGDFDCGHGVAA